MLLSKVARTQHSIKSAILKREVKIDLFIPNDLFGNEILNLLLLNDGQDATALDLEQTLNELYEKNRLQPTVLVAIHASENRTQEYGIAGVPDFLNRGASASLYLDFIFTELLPYIQEQVGMPILGKKDLRDARLAGSQHLMSSGIMQNILTLQVCFLALSGGVKKTLKMDIQMKTVLCIR